jgi:4-diphosphocytidyl-2-C-methyl-D-erythritol kinase
VRRQVVHCPAKVNLHLEVLGRRGDGFHEVRSLLAAVGVFDRLAVQEAPEGVLELTVAGAGEVPVEGNTVLRAATLLRERWGVRRGARVFLEKRIPVAAGLGGGSADGAGALVALSRLWGLPTTWEALYPLAAALGADVPFFLLGGVCWGVGRGEEVYPLPDLPPLWVVLLPGREPVPTAAVYRALQAPPLRPFTNGKLYAWLLSGGELPVAALANDLQPTVATLYPWVRQSVEQLARFSPLLAMLAGSGGTVFGLFAEEVKAREAAEGLAERGAILAPLLGREQSALLP